MRRDARNMLLNSQHGLFAGIKRITNMSWEKAVWNSNWRMEILNSIYKKCDNNRTIKLSSQLRWWFKNIVELNYYCSTNSGPPSVKRLFGVPFISAFFFLSPYYTVEQVPLAFLAYPWTVTYIHTYISRMSHRYKLKHRSRLRHWD